MFNHGDTDRWPTIAAVGAAAAAAAAAAFGQVIVAAVQAGQQSSEVSWARVRILRVQGLIAILQDRDIQDLQERIRAIEEQLRQVKTTSQECNPEPQGKVRENQSRVEGSKRLSGSYQKDEFGDILTRFETTLKQENLITSTLPVCCTLWRTTTAHADNM